MFDDGAFIAVFSRIASVIQDQGLFFSPVERIVFVVVVPVVTLSTNLMPESARPMALAPIAARQLLSSVTSFKLQLQSLPEY